MAQLTEHLFSLIYVLQTIQFLKKNKKVSIFLQIFMQRGSNSLPPIWCTDTLMLVETEQNTGKWSDSEKKIFNTYYKLYESIPDKYNLMTQYIPSRTASQIRSHWQKFNEKMQRDCQKIERRKSAQDFSQGKNLFEPGFQFFKSVASDILIETEEQLLNSKSIQLNLNSQMLGKQNLRTTRSMASVNSKISLKIEQEVNQSMKRHLNYIIVPPPSSWTLQKRDQLQKYGKANENTNSQSHFESIKRENRDFEKQRPICYQKAYFFNRK